MSDKLMDKEKEYYERADLWNPENIRKSDQERITKVLSHIKSNYSSLLDVGCGNGIFCNKLLEDRPFLKRIVGMDRSNEALKHVKTEKKNGAITAIPFDNNEFDVVCALEVIEHIPENDFQIALDEISRVAKNRIIITVPNNENLKESMITCSKCGVTFHRNYHQRTFDLQFLENLFKNYGFRCTLVEKVGIKHEKIFLKQFQEFLNTGKNKSMGQSLCPNCGHSEGRIIKNAEKKNNKMKKIINLLWPKTEKFRWLLAIYES